MPSLNALGEFKASFNDIANEKKDVKARAMPFDDLALPTNEAPPFDIASSRSSLPSIESDFDINSMLDSIGVEDSSASFDDILQDISSGPSDDNTDFMSDLLNNLGGEDSATPDDGASFLDNLGSEDSATPDDGSSFLDNLGSEESATPDDGASFLDDILQGDSGEPESADAPLGTDDLSVPDDLLSGLTEETEPTPADLDTPAEGTDDFGLDDLLAGLGGEDAPSEDVPSEDASAEPGGESADTVDFDGLDLGGITDTPADDTVAEESPDALDLGDLDLGGITDTPADDTAADESPDALDLGDLDLGGLADTPADDTAAEESPDALDLGGLDLGGITDTPADDTAADESPDTVDFSGMDLGRLADESDINEGLDEAFDLGGEAPPELPDTDLGDTGINDGLDEAFDLGGETPPESSDLDAAAFDLGDISTEPQADTPADFEEEALDLGGEALDLGGESPSSEPPGDDGGFDLNAGSPLPDFGSPESADAGTDSLGSFDLGDFGADFDNDSIQLGNEAETHAETDFGDGGGFGTTDFGTADFGDSDFELPGLEDIFEKTKAPITIQPAPKKGLFKKKKAKADELPEAEDNIEEISLTEGEVENLLKTLSVYPLNLRIACEEIIAEQAILPAQLSRLIRLLVNGANVRETAAHVELITGKPVIIPKSFEKMTGSAFEAEQGSFAYIFVHNFLPVLRLFLVIAALAASVAYLGYKFIYIPLYAESIYKRGYERIPAGEYQRATELFHDAFLLHRKKKWFYSYAEAFRDERRYMLAENMYDELLRYYQRDKKGVLDYADLETNYLMNYEKANWLLQEFLLNFSPNDAEGLLAAGDNFLAWADSDPSKHYDRYEDARFSYARLLELYGWEAPIVERMMKFFIRTDNLKETLYLRAWFENNKKANLSAVSLSELGGYLLDKQLEQPQGVPDAYIESIESVRSMLLQAVRMEPTLPEPHYHLARYYNNLGNTYEERLTLENAIRAFELPQAESVRRRRYHVDTRYRYANLLINNKEFFKADEQLVKGIELYEDFLRRDLMPASPQLGQLYSARGDLDYFVKTGDMQAALSNYLTAERYGYSPPEIQYRMGSAYYQLENWRSALEYLFKASTELPQNRRILYALGNVAFKRGDYYAAEGYYNRLLNILESQRIRLPVLLPNDSPQFYELGLRLMWARNNAGVVYEKLAEQTGNREYRSRAMVLYMESSMAWDPITRNPSTMERSMGLNLGYLNSNNALRPVSDYDPEIFIHIDKDVLEPSRWEELAPVGGLVNQ